jgi:tetratricopeptide (TPR) repeat protein
MMGPMTAIRAAGARGGGRLVGREAALAATGAALEDALAGTGGLLLVVGEPGIGKSALLAEQARRAGAAGIRVVRGAGWAGAPPYWLWTQVLRGLAGDAMPGVARLLDRGAGAADPDDPFRLFDAVRAALADNAPLLVVLDDLHVADNDALRLLDFLHRTLVADRVLLLGACRDEEAAPSLRALAAAVPGLPLVGLDTDGVAALITEVAGPAPEAAVAEAVRRRCGGNPLFVRELTRLMVAGGELTEQVGPIPGGVRDTLRLRLDRLTPGCRDLLEVAAVAGPVVAPAVLAAVGPDDEVAVADLLDEAERARVLVRAGGVLRFSHDLYRECVLEQLPAERRAQLHAAVGHALVRLSDDGADPAAVGGAARLAAHFVAAGPRAAAEGLRWTLLAADEATDRLGHEDAAGHYATALDLLPEGAPGRRIALLLRFAAAWFRAGDPVAARDAYLRVAELARYRADPRALAEAALGVAALGARSGTDDPVGIGLLTESVARPPEEAALCSRVHAELARALRHSAYEGLDPRAVPLARRAVALARSCRDTRALAHALLADHDVRWAPGTAAERLAVLTEMAEAADAGGDAELAAEAVLLQAAALVERGEPEGVARLARYVRLAERLGTAHGRWGALSRQATLAQMAGRVAEAVEFADRALALGRAIGLPDAQGVHATLRSSLVPIGGPAPTDAALPADDPMWPLQPLLRAWRQVQDGDVDGAAAVMRGFSVQTIPHKYDLELVAISTAVLVAVGSPDQRSWAYDAFRPYAGLHAVVGGCAAYHGVVDHALGVLAAALGRHGDAVGHLEAAVAHHERLGTTAWAQLSRSALDQLVVSNGDPVFRPADGRWLIEFGGRGAFVADAKGMHDIAVLLAAPGRPVHVFTLLGREQPVVGADPVLDRRAAAGYRARLDTLRAEADDAERAGDPWRAERARAERVAVARELRLAAGLGGRPRRLGDETERARKTVTARVRDALRRIGAEHPAAAAHLRQALQTGTQCIYLPDPPLRWRL